MTARTRLAASYAALQAANIAYARGRHTPSAKALSAAADAAHGVLLNAAADLDPDALRAKDIIGWVEARLASEPEQSHEGEAA